MQLPVKYSKRAFACRGIINFLNHPSEQGKIASSNQVMRKIEGSHHVGVSLMHDKVLHNFLIRLLNQNPGSIT